MHPFHYVDDDDDPNNGLLVSSGPGGRSVVLQVQTHTHTERERERERERLVCVKEMPTSGSLSLDVPP